MAVQYMHTKKIAHRDIRLQTLFVQTDQKTDISINVVSLGQAKLFDEKGYTNELPSNYANMDSIAGVHRNPAFFRAPETFKLGRQHGMKVDEYAVGVLAYLFLIGDGQHYPFDISDNNALDDLKIYNQLD